MSPQQTGGSGRRRIAGDAARRRRETPASPTDETQDTVVEPPVEEPTEQTRPETGEAGIGEAPEPAEAEPGEDRQKGRAPRRPAFAAPPKQTWWWLGALAVVTVCALVFVGVVGARHLSERSDDAALADARAAATSAAATAAEKILSYDYKAIETERSDAGKLMTDDFLKEYDELYSGKYCDVIPEQNCTETGTFAEVIKSRKQSVEASVVDVAPLECGDDCSQSKVTVLLFIDQATTIDGKQLPPNGTQAKFTMVKQGGSWLVDDIV